MKIEGLLEKHQSFLDETAKDVMKLYIRNKPPQSFGDSISIAKIAYKQAIAMLDVKLNMIVALANESKTLVKQKRGGE